MRHLLLITCLTVAVTANAQTVWKLKDRSGNYVFSDTPVEGAQAVEISRPSVISNENRAAPLPRGIPATTPAPAASATYTRAAITSPSNETNFSNDPSPLVVTGVVEPRLQAGHKARLMVDGQPAGTLADTPTFTIPPLDRGEHKVVLEVVDSNLHVLISSAPVTLYVHRHSALFKTPAVGAGHP